ncbi:unnamed protein product [Candidula unifasciata]|uniref:Essential for reactive oxygen species protein n=1 Tax=Candidula unifasciata TaxID=100452 RepID=A0A8S3Z7U2_9EUPU|nr:unnamed protein product [Candidula unifasciata]
MGYMSIKKHTDTQLSLLREPTFLSKAVFVGFFIGVVGIIVFGSESLFFKILIGLGATLLSFLIVDNYEICEFDKITSEVRITRLHWCQYLLGCFGCIGTSPYVKARLEDIKDVRVEEQEGNSSGRAYHVVLSLHSGIQLGVTEIFTTDDLSEHESTAKLIRSFLGDLPPVEVGNEADVEDEDISSSEDDFEQISPAELEDLNETEDVKGNPLFTDDREASGDCKELLPEESDKAEACEENPS